MAEIVCYVYIFHLTWLMSLHYLVKSGCFKFLPNTGFVTIRLLRFDVKVKRAHCRDNFLLRGHCQTCAGCPETIVYLSRRWHLGTSSRDTVAFLERQRVQETRRHLSACVHVRGAHFEQEFWQFWADLSWQLITLRNKPYSVYCVLIQSSDTLLQIIYFNLM